MWFARNNNLRFAIYLYTAISSCLRPPVSISRSCLNCVRLPLWAFEPVGRFRVVEDLFGLGVPLQFAAQAE